MHAYDLCCMHMLDLQSPETLELNCSLLLTQPVVLSAIHTRLPFVQPAVTCRPLT